MREIACADKLQTFDFCVTTNFFDTHLLASCSTIAAVNVQISDNPDLRLLPELLAGLGFCVLLVLSWFGLKTYHESAKAKDKKKRVELLRSESSRQCAKG